jgi:hypothetical protein
MNFDHLDGIDVEGGRGPKLPEGTYWLRFAGARQIVSKDPKTRGQTFLILDVIVVNSLNPQSMVQPGSKFGHGMNQNNAFALGKVMKALIGCAVGRGANEVPGNWVGVLITQPNALLDCVFQFEISQGTSQQGNQYSRWAPMGLVPDDVVRSYLGSINPTVKTACFPNGLRSDRGVPAPITFFIGGAAPAPTAAPYPPQMPPQQPPQYAPAQQPPQYAPQPPQMPPQWPNQPPQMQPPAPMQPPQWPGQR